MNNTTRELGGTLGVAVIGSVFASSYGPKIASAFHGLPIPAEAKSAAGQSIAAALSVVRHAPAGVQPTIRSTVDQAFSSGLEVACLVAAGVAVLGALVSFRFLPSRVERPDGASITIH